MTARLDILQLEVFFSSSSFSCIWVPVHGRFIHMVSDCVRKMVPTHLDSGLMATLPFFIRVNIRSHTLFSSFVFIISYI